MQDSYIKLISDLEKTYETIAETVIAEVFPPSIEKKLINDYNAFVLGLLTLDKYRDNYIALITERERLKDQIKSDLENI